MIPRGMILGLLLGACAPAPPPADPAPQFPTYILVVATGNEAVGVFARHADRLWPLTHVTAGDSALAPLPTELLGPGDTLRLSVAVWWQTHPIPLAPFRIRRGALNRIPILAEIRANGRIGG